MYVCMYVYVFVQQKNSKNLFCKLSRKLREQEVCDWWLHLRGEVEIGRHRKLPAHCLSFLNYYYK